MVEHDNTEGLGREAGIKVLLRKGFANSGIQKRANLAQHALEHFSGKSTRLGVLLAGVIGTKQPRKSRWKDQARTMRESQFA
jgi:hypothetical protein